MAHQINLNKTKSNEKEGNNILSGQSELGKPVTKLDALLFMETVLCDMQSLYVLLEMLVEKNVIDYDEFKRRLDAKTSSNVDSLKPYKDV